MKARAIMWLYGHDAWLRFMPIRRSWVVGYGDARLTGHRNPISGVWGKGAPDRVAAYRRGEDRALESPDAS